MLNNEKLDSLIKNSLLQKVEAVEPSEEMYSKIIRRIESKNKSNKSILKYRISNFKIRRWVVTTVCSFFILAVVMLSFSEDVRAATLDVINTIKTIFVLDKTESGEYVIVEKPAGNVLFTPMCGSTTTLTDGWLTEKVGFNVYFPRKLNGEFYLNGKGTAVGILKPVSVEVAKQLSTVQLSAFNNEEAFNSLAEYKPFRSVDGTYMGPDNVEFYISMQSKDTAVEYYKKYDIADRKIVKTNVGDAKAFWREFAFPKYEQVRENGMGQSDISKRPDEIIKGYNLSWESNGVNYHLSPSVGTVLTMKEAVEIAEAFMEAQK